MLARPTIHRKVTRLVFSMGDRPPMMGRISPMRGDKDRAIPRHQKEKQKQKRNQNQNENKNEKIKQSLNPPRAAAARET